MLTTLLHLLPINELYWLHGVLFGKSKHGGLVCSTTRKVADNSWQQKNPIILRVLNDIAAFIFKIIAIRLWGC